MITSKESSDSPPAGRPDTDKAAGIDWSVVEDAFRKSLTDLRDAGTQLAALAAGRSANDVVSNGHEELRAELSATRATLARLEEWLRAQ